MKFSQLYNKLKRAGYDPELATVQNVTPSGAACSIIIVHHDYTGPHPTREALAAYEAITATARRAGYYSEPRGHKSATYIYDMSPAAYMETRRAWTA